MIVYKTNYLEKMENLPNDTCIFEKISLKNNESLSFAINQEKRVENVFKKLVMSPYISDETTRTLEPIGTRPGVMYGLCKSQKDIINNRSLFQPICNSNHMFGRAIFDKLPKGLFRNLEMAWVKQGQYQNFQKLRGSFTPKIAEPNM